MAEEEVFGDITTGASNDLERVTSLARRMVTQYGMSDVLGPQTFGEKEELIFLGREIGEQRNYSEEIAEEIDREVRKLVDEAYERARDHHPQVPRQAGRAGPASDRSRDGGRERVPGDVCADNLAA